MTDAIKGSRSRKGVFVRQIGKITLPQWHAWPLFAAIGMGSLALTIVWMGFAATAPSTSATQERLVQFETLSARADSESALWRSSAELLSRSALALANGTAPRRPGTSAAASPADTFITEELSRPESPLSGLMILDQAGLILAIGGDAPASSPAVSGNLAQGLSWEGGRAVLTLSLGAGRRAVALVRPGRLTAIDILPDAVNERVGLLFRNGHLVGLSRPLSDIVVANATIAAGEALPSLLYENATIERVLRPIAGTGVTLVRETPLLPGGERRTAFLVGAAIILLQVGLALAVLGWTRQRLNAMQAQASDELERSRARATRSVNEVLNALPGTVYRGELFADHSLSMSSMGENVERLTGFIWADLAQPDAWQRRVEAADEALVIAHRAELYREGEATVEYRFRNAKGQPIWLREQSRIVGVSANGGAEIIGYITDFSNEKNLAAQTNASAKLATLGRMAAALAHELTQPISVMMLAAENALAAHEMEGDAALPAMVQRLNRVLEQAQRAQGVVDHLRVFGRADNGQLEPVNIGSAIDGAMLLTAAALERAGIETSVVVSRRLPPVSGSRVMLEQVIMNLIINARDAMQRVPDGQRRLALRVRSLGEKGLELQVSDSGTGLAPEAQQRLFEPFFTTKPSGQGMGLGLSICHGLIRSFGGEITGFNGEGGGATFVVRLPLFSVAQAEPSLETAVNATNGEPHARSGRGEPPANRSKPVRGEGGAGAARLYH